MKGTKEALLASQDMVPVAGTVEVQIPVEELWRCFRRANFWPRWNACFRWVRNRDLVKGENLVWAFNPIRWFYPYLMPATARIVEVEPPNKVTWEVTVLPGFFARHTYEVVGLGEGRSRFGSWEQAMGWGFRLMKWFWIAHFTFVKDRSLEGARRLEAIYRETGRLDLEDRPKLRTVPRAGRVFLWLLLLLLLAAASSGLWFYRSFVRLSATELAPGVTAVFGGGSNALVVESGGEVLVVDPKFPPGSRHLRRWVAKHTRAPVTAVVNTHYHYDHTQGNVLYPGARIYAVEGVRGFMEADDPDFWRGGAGLPTEAVRGALRLTVGSEELVLHAQAEPAHTHGDLWVELPRHGVIATGDIVFHTYYPFLDTQAERGASVPGMVRVLRGWAADHPEARFLPGHGPLARAADLGHYADYLETLWRGAQAGAGAGRVPPDAALEAQLAPFDLAILPSMHNTLLPIWATARRNVRDAYTLATAAAAGGRP